MPKDGDDAPPSSKRSTAGKRRNRSEQLNRKSIFAATISLLLVAMLTGCGSADEGATSESRNSDVETNTRIFDHPDILTADDLVSLGLKSGKEYDVATLPGGVEARLLFWRIQDTAVEYEARFYESHADAVDLGAAPAEEGSGEDAVLDVDKADYKEGVKDRRAIFDFRGTIKPKYGAYAIFANMVLLCEGRDDAEAWHRCTALIEALENR